MHKYRFSQHLQNRKHIVRHFWGMVIVSILVVFGIAILSRAELRLSGELLAAGDSSDLVILTKMEAYSDVTLVRETDDLRLYLLKGEDHDFLAHVLLTEGEWVVDKVEKVRR